VNRGPRREQLARLRLERIGLARARAILDGDLSGVSPGPGWPHADTLDGIRMDTGARTDSETGFLAVLIDTGQVIGDAGWKGGPDESGVAEIGYGLAAPSRGHGLGSELVGLIADWAAAQAGVRRVVAEVHVSNLPSQRALERNGFNLAQTQPLYLIYERPVGHEVTDE
jgi:RimJ/RimL family protein N-acetyltransferase